MFSNYFRDINSTLSIKKISLEVKKLALILLTPQNLASSWMIGKTVSNRCIENGQMIDKIYFSLNTYLLIILYTGLVYGPIIVSFYLVIKIEVELPPGQGN